MKKAGLVLLILIIISWSTGCVMQQHNAEIEVTSPDISSPDTIHAGSVDLYTPQFRITNPSNRTYTNILVRININPLLTYCHPLSKEFEIPVLNPGQKRIEQVSIAEFVDMDCQYSYTYEVVSNP
ncbi:MAG: hypothetical protein WC586_05535 [Methanoregula sp.]